MFQMSSYEELEKELKKKEKEFEEKVKKLRKECPHEELNDFEAKNPYSDCLTIFEYQACKRCGLIINTRAKCIQCGSYVIDAIEKGDRVLFKIKEEHFLGDFFKKPTTIFRPLECFCSKECIQKYKEDFVKYNAFKHIKISKYKEI